MNVSVFTALDSRSSTERERERERVLTLYKVQGTRYVHNTCGSRSRYYFIRFQILIDHQSI